MAELGLAPLSPEQVDAARDAAVATAAEPREQMAGTAREAAVKQRETTAAAAVIVEVQIAAPAEAGAASAAMAEKAAEAVEESTEDATEEAAEAAAEEIAEEAAEMPTPAAEATEEAAAEVLAVEVLAVKEEEPTAMEAAPEAGDDAAAAPRAGPSRGSSRLRKGGSGDSSAETDAGDTNGAGSACDDMQQPALSSEPLRTVCRKKSQWRYVRRFQGMHAHRPVPAHTSASASTSVHTCVGLQPQHWYMTRNVATIEQCSLPGWL